MRCTASACTCPESKEEVARLGHDTGCSWQTGDGHDWVLVLRQDYTMLTGEYNTGKLLWACPCGEFKWTSYTEWEKRKGEQDMAAKRALEVGA